MSQIGNNRNTNKFVVRLPNDLRERISDVARLNHRSLNAEIIHLIECSLDQPQDGSNGQSGRSIDLDKIEGQLMGLMSQFIHALKTPDATDLEQSHTSDSGTDQALNGTQSPQTAAIQPAELLSNKRASLPLGEHLSEELDQWINRINIDHLIGTLKSHLKNQDATTQKMLTDVLVLWRSSELSMLHALDEASHSISRQIDVIEQCINECQQSVNPAGDAQPESSVKSREND